MLLEKVTIQYNDPVQSGYVLMALYVPDMTGVVRPGQFVHLRIPNRPDLVLRRPFSIYRADENGVLSILYKKVGEGTRGMATLKAGTTMDVMGPLGNGYPDAAVHKTPVLVAGGYGVAALYLVAKRSPKKGILIAGGRTADDMLCLDEFASLGWDVRVTTDDGSMGTKGFVTQVLDGVLQEYGDKAELFACGPEGMLKAVSERGMQWGATAWISLDHHMACGVGACLACVQKINYDGQEKLARVCKDGPVFECRTIVWE